MTSSIDIHEMSTSFRIELLKLSNAAFFILTSSNETDASDSSSTTSRNSYIVGAVVGGILGVLILFGLASIAHFRYVILPQSQKERETRISDTWDDSFRPSLIISSWVSRVVSTRLSISRQPIKSEMDSYSSDYPINDNGDNTIGRPSIDPDADSVFHSSTDPVLRTSPKHDSSRLSIQESIRENLRESGQSSRDSNISKNDRHNPNQPNSLSSGLSVLRTSPLGRSPVVLARSMDSSRRRANTGGSSSSSSSPVEVSIKTKLYYCFDL